MNTSTSHSADPDPESPDAPVTIRVARGLKTYDIGSLIRQGSTLSSTDTLVSLALAGWVNTRSGFARITRDELSEETRLSLKTISLSLQRLRTLGVWHVKPGRGGNLVSKDTGGTYITSRYFLRESFVLEALDRMTSKAVAIAERKGDEDAQEATNSVIDRIRHELEVMTIDADAHLVSVERFASPMKTETTPEKPVEAPAVEKPVEAPKVTDTATVTPVAPAPAPAPVARVEAPVAPSTRLDAPRDWKVSPLVVTTFIGLNATPVLEFLEASPQLGAINEAAKSARIAALLGHLPQASVSDALTLRAKAATASGDTPAMPEVGGWLIAQLQEINAEIRNGKHAAAAA